MNIPDDYKMSFKMQAEDVLIDQGIDLDAYSSALTLEEAQALLEDVVGLAEKAFLAGVEWANKKQGKP